MVGGAMVDAGVSDTRLDAGASVSGVPAERCGHVLLPEWDTLVARALSSSSACSCNTDFGVCLHRDWHSLSSRRSQS